MGPSSTRDVFRYFPLVSSGVRTSRTPTIASFSLGHILTVILTIIFAATAGFYAGQTSVGDNNQSIIPLTTKTEVFRYDRTFGEAPSNSSDAAWLSLFPKQGGFFKHPTIAPQRSAFSVFHQLHCLDGIRRGYWAIYAAAVEGLQIADEDLPFMSSPPHIRHCIDLIRHSLMCQPDLTVELKEKELGGVRGFGTKHECRDWDELIDWTSKWETYKQDPPSKGTHNMGHEHHV